MNKRKVIIKQLRLKFGLWQWRECIASHLPIHFGTQFDQMQDEVDIAKVYDAMLQDDAWFSVVDEMVVSVLGSRSPVNTMYGVFP